MILWSGNYKLEENTYKDMGEKLKSIPKSYDLTNKHYSSYYLELKDRPDHILNEFYIELSNHVCNELTLYNRIRYNQAYWMQLYPPQSNGHLVHDHFSGREVYSWVHFIKPVEKSFHFLVNGKKIYPEQQNPGDYIVFPSWALHAVDANNSSEERIVIAGNLLFESIEVNLGNGTTKTSICHSINNDVCVWNSYEQ